MATSGGSHREAGADEPPRAAVLVAGEGPLRIVDPGRSGPWLIRRLGELGFRLTGMTVAGGERGVVGSTLRHLLDRNEVVAALSGSEAGPDREFREAVGLLADRSGGGGDARAESAPGRPFPLRGALLVVLPREGATLRDVFTRYTGPTLADRFGSRLPRLHRAVIPTAGLSPGRVRRMAAEALAEVPGVATTVAGRRGGVDLILEASASRDAEKADERADAALRRAEEAVGEALGPFRLPARGKALVGKVARALEGRGRTLAVAESCTGGLLAARLTARPGASAYFQGGVVCYADEVKVREAGVAPETLERHGAVSRAVAEELAMGVRARLGTDLAISITGVAGPGGGSREKPVGLVWVALGHPEGVEGRRVLLPGGRGAVRTASTEVALTLLLGHLEGEVGAGPPPRGRTPPGAMGT